MKRLVNINTTIDYHIHSNFQGSYILRKASLKDFCGLIFAGHQVEYIVYFFLRIKGAQQAYSEICKIYIPQKLSHNQAI